MHELHQFHDKKFPGDALEADLVNALKQIATRLGMMVLPANAYGFDNNPSPYPPFRQFLFEVVGLIGGDEESTGSSSSSSSPSSSSGSSTAGAPTITDAASDVYAIQPRYFDVETAKWKTDEKRGPWELDAESQNLTFGEGDVIVAYWDPQRQMWIPIEGGSGSSSAGGGGGGALTITFEICEACCQECWADVTILSVSEENPTIPGAGATLTKCGCGEDLDSSSSSSNTTSSSSSSSVSTSSSSSSQSGESSSSSSSSSISTSSSSLGDCVKILQDCQVRVYDVLGCHLTERNDVMPGRKGRATYMYQTEEKGCTTCEEYETLFCNEGVSYIIPASRWEIDMLCCVISGCGEL